MPSLDQFRPQHLIIVYLTVANDLHRAIASTLLRLALSVAEVTSLVVDGLLPCAKVNDAEATVP